MADKDSENLSGTSYELDLDDTISAWDQVVEEAVAAVEKKYDVRSVRDVRDATRQGAKATEGRPADVAAEGRPADVAAEGREDEAAQAAGEQANEADEVPAPAAGAPAAGAPAAAAAEEPKAEREDGTEVRELRDRLVRTLADFDNFRKRTEREKASLKRFALFDVLGDFLGVSDNLERALAASGSTQDLKKGVEMIARQFTDLLARHGVEPVTSVGEVFDPTIHEAVTREEGADVTEPTVTAELQRGYRLHDRLLRPALVTVAMPPPPPPPAEEASSEETEDEADFEVEAQDEPEDLRPDGEENDEAPGETFAQATEVS